MPGQLEQRPLRDAGGTEAMPKPKPGAGKVSSRDHHRQYLAWRAKVERYPVASDSPTSYRIADLPEARRESLIYSILLGRSRWSPPDSWVWSFIDPRDLPEEAKKQ